jgi:integrase
VRVYAGIHPVPDAISRRYQHLVTGPGIRTTLHKLRHCSATELITAGVDLRAIAGRLGHADNGRTTLRYYTAWVNEADQRASHTLMTRLPTPCTPPATQPAPAAQPASLYSTIAAERRTAITTGALPPGTTLPTVQQLAATHHVAPSTAHRAITLLAREGLVTVTCGRRAIANSPGPGALTVCRP